MKNLFALLLFPLMIFAQDSTLNGDVDCNGEINSEDASLILQFVTNVIDELPCEENMTGLTPQQLQEIINIMDEQLSVNYMGNGGSNYPSMISTQSTEALVFTDALDYCYNLEEDGYNDWYMPLLDELTYAASGGVDFPDEKTNNYLWTRSMGHGATAYFTTIRLIALTYNSLQWDGGNNDGSSSTYVRCVRFGEGEVSNGSEGSLGLSSSTENSEQPISMIGPMYKQSEFVEFNHYFKYNYPESTSNYIYYPDAIRFCAQLSYGGFDDWFLPSFIQIQNYLKNNPNNFTIPNFNENNSYYFWLFLNEIQTSGNGGYLYSPTLEVTGSLHAYPNMSTTFISYSLSDYYPHCFCVR